MSLALFRRHLAKEGTSVVDRISGISLSIRFLRSPRLVPLPTSRTWSLSSDVPSRSGDTSSLVIAADGELIPDAGQVVTGEEGVGADDVEVVRKNDN